jgi:decaprenylphospho-beta-D-ribofuranose 2-oxidase
MFQNSYQISFDKGVKIETNSIEFNLISNSNVKYLISQGGCQSLAAASFGSQSTSLISRYNKQILKLDLLELTVDVEAGITLGELDDYLFPKGFQIRCQPGHSLITVGGAIAAETHGTNQYKFGSFSSQIRSLKLFHPDRGIFETSPSNCPEIFDLTIGGYGLTGHIISAVIDIRRIDSFVRLNSAKKVSSLNHYFEVMNESAKLNEESHSWLRYNCKNQNLSGVIFSSNYVAAKQSEVSVAKHSGNASIRRLLPINLWNTQSTALINQIYIKTYGFTFSSSYTSAARGYFLSTKSLFYYNLYGSRGFHEYSMIIDDFHLADVLKLAHTKARQLAIPVPLVSTKPFIGENKYLRFVGTGTCLTFNFPRNSRSEDLMEYLDQILLDVKGIPSIIKDSRLPGWVVKKSFPDYEIFKSRIINYDPSRRFRSELSERLELDRY